MARIKKNQTTEPPAENATVEADVDPTIDGERVQAQHGSFTLPSLPNTAAVDGEETRPMTKAERKDLFYGSAEDRA